MYDFPAVCGKCGLIFSGGIAFGPNVRNVVVRGNVTSCPNCGALSRIQDGGIDSQGRMFLVRDVFNALTSPGVTRRDVERAEAVLTSANPATANGADIAAKLVDTSPQLAPLAQLLRSKAGPALVKAVEIILLAVAAYFAWVAAVAAKSQALSGELQTQAAMIQAGAALAEGLSPDAKRELLESLAAQYDAMQRDARMQGRRAATTPNGGTESARVTQTHSSPQPRREKRSPSARKHARGNRRARCRCGSGRPRVECCGTPKPQQN